jgi:DNA-binding NarL/FixJ family response regulator
MIRLMIADDHPIVREGVKRIIQSCADMELIDELENGYEALIECGDREFDVLLMDITMPGTDFQNLIRRLKKLNPELKILVLSVHAEEHYALRALKAGASGYLTKDRTPEELETAIRHVYKGKTYITASLAERLAQRLTAERKRGAYDELSERECQILRLLGAGMRVSDIARKLNLSPKTVSTYRARIFEKMQFKSITDLVRYTVEFDLVE